ncbi:hypothetical protein [Actinocorallia longicatena]|uniref:HEAT repeat protein n=1 Tax=Actinocorallia longicatena TaxID=111803 RepID=A0ABP6QB52_9ACTN
MPTMRSGPASHDAQFRGFDTDALAHLIQQMRTASSAIDGWLAAHPPPPGVSSAGYRQALTVQLWINEQIGMLTRRRIYALTHQDTPDVTSVPPATPVRPAPVFESAALPPSKDLPDPPGLTDTEIGAYPDSAASMKGATSDALAVREAIQNHQPIPADVWKRIQAHAKDPDYTRTLYQQLGPAGTARLIDAAEGDKARVKALITSLTFADSKLHLDSAWVASLLAESGRLGSTSTAVQILNATPLAPHVDDALGLVEAGLVTSKAV